MVLNHRSGHLCRHHGGSSSACGYGSTRPAKFVGLDPDVREHGVRDAYARVGRDHNGRLVVEPSCPSKSKCHRAVPTVNGWRVKASASGIGCLRVVDPCDGSGPHHPAGTSEVPLPFSPSASLREPEMRSAYGHTNSHREERDRGVTSRRHPTTAIERRPFVLGLEVADRNRCVAVAAELREFLFKQQNSPCAKTSE